MKHIVLILCLLFALNLDAQKRILKTDEIKMDGQKINKIDSVLSASHNAIPTSGAVKRQLDSLANGPGLDSLIQSGRNFTFHAGDSAYSMRSIDTFYIDGSDYKLVIGTDTFTLAGITDLGDVYYVAPDGEGNNATAQVGNPNLPWADLSAAIDSAGGAGTIYVLAGTHTFTFKNVAGIPINMYMEAGATINTANFFTGIDTTLIISGSGRVVASNSFFTFSDNYNSYSYASFQSLQANGFTINDRITLDNDTTGGFFLDVENLNVNNTFVFAGANTDALKDFTFFFSANRVTATITSGEEIFFKVGDIENSDFFFNIKNMELEGSKDLGILFRPGDSGADKTNMNLVFNIDRGEFWTATSRSSPGAGYIGLALVGIDGTFDSTQVVLNCVFCELNEVQLLGTTVPRTGSIDADFIFRGKYKINRNYGASYVVNWTNPTTNINVIFEGDFTVDSVFYSNQVNRNSNLVIRNSVVKTLSDYSPIMQIKSNAYGTNEIRNSRLIHNSGVAPISGASGTVLLSNVQVSGTAYDNNIAYTVPLNIGSNAIGDRLQFGNYTIDQNAYSVRFDTINQFVAVTENSQNYYSLMGNIEIRADSGNVVLNGGTYGEIKAQGDSLFSKIIGASAFSDGILGSLVLNDAGEFRVTDRTLPRFDTVNVSTANDTLNIDFAFDQTVVVDMNSAPATVDFIVENPVKGSTLTFVFVGVGSSHTFNFGHTDIQLGSKTGWTIDGSSAKVYVLRYNIDGGGDWIILRDE